MTKETDAISYMEGLVEGRKQGRKVVVEWVNAHLHKSPGCSYKWCFGDRTWRAMLKGWGIEE